MPNQNSGVRKWTPEQDSRLAKLWTEGASASEIAADLNCGLSRSAVIGRAHRLKLAGRIARRRVHEISRPKQHGNKGTPKANAIVARARSAAAARRQSADNEHFRPGSLPPEDNAGVDVTSLIGIEDLRRGVITQCRWIHGEAGADARYCGRPVKPGTSWCPEHHSRVFKRAAD